MLFNDNKLRNMVSAIREDGNAAYTYSMRPPKWVLDAYTAIALKIQCYDC